MILKTYLPQKQYLISMINALILGTSLPCGASSFEEEDFRRAIRVSLQGVQEEESLGPNLPIDPSHDQEDIELARALALSRITSEQEEQDILAEVALFQEKTARQDIILSQDQAYYGGLYQDEAKELIPHLTAQICLLEETIGQMEEEQVRLTHDIRRAGQSERLQIQLPVLQKKCKN